MPKSRRLRGTRRIKSRRMRGGNNPTDSATLDRAEEDASMSESGSKSGSESVSEPVSNPVSEPVSESVSEPLSDTEVTGDQSETTMSSSLTDKARNTATMVLASVTKLGRSFGNWLGFGGKSRKNHRKSRKNRRKSRKNRKH